MNCCLIFGNIDTILRKINIFMRNNLDVYYFGYFLSSSGSRTSTVIRFVVFLCNDKSMISCQIDIKMMSLLALFGAK